MIKINGTKGIWTLGEVVDLLKDANVPFKLIIDPVFNNYEIEVDTNPKSEVVDKAVKVDNVTLPGKLADKIGDK
jgi:hypothetical protein